MLADTPSPPPTFKLQHFVADSPEENKHAHKLLLQNKNRTRLYKARLEKEAKTKIKEQNRIANQELHNKNKKLELLEIQERRRRLALRTKYDADGSQADSQRLPQEPVDDYAASLNRIQEEAVLMLYDNVV